ncbi:hypothetical protein L3Q82_024837, partial [Scortum barcoo]
GSEPKLSNSYHTKPLLFGELKDKGKAFGILDKFEEDKKMAKEKTDSDILAKECHHFRETLNNIQQLVAGTEKNTAVCQTVLEKFDNFVSTLQNNLNSLQSGISQQFETFLDKVNSQREMMAALEEKLQKNGEIEAELASSQQILKTSLECLREEQQRERNMLEEALKLLGTLVSEHSCKLRPERVTDSAIQTSPEKVEKPLSDMLQDNKLDGTQLTCISNEQAEVPPQGPSCIMGKRKCTLRGQRRRRKRPLVISQRSKPATMDENSEPLTTCHKQKNVSAPLCERHGLNAVTGRDGTVPLGRETRSIAAGRVITPLSCWSQDSNSSACLAGAEPIFEKLSAKSKTRSPAKPKGFWQLFEIDCDSDLGF